MLFNSSVFLFQFLPVTLALYYLSLRYGGLVLAQVVLLLASLWFYAYDTPALLWLVLGSCLLNYLFSLRLAKQGSSWLLTLGVTANLLLLFVFKYADFATANLNAALGAALPLPGIALPLGISFLTFHQISYLVDVKRGITKPGSWWRFLLYISFFPHLIAGPIVRHAELMPQLLRKLSPNWSTHLAVGLTVFVIGLAKKVLIADPLAVFADPVFAAADKGEAVSFMMAWLASLAYMLQIYFDFSGYSDMAIGLARMFGLRLPINFMAPYRATSIIEFWRRWHMTLSRFLRDYLYFSLGGNRSGPTRRWGNLMIVMLLGGLWHGASWSFAVWGGLHGLYLIINHAWQSYARQHYPARKKSTLWTVLSWSFTMLAVLVAWVFFRAESLAGAAAMLSAMVSVPVIDDWQALRQSYKSVNYLVLGGLLVLLAPTATQLLAMYRPAMPPAPPVWRFRKYILLWKPSLLWAFLTAALLFAVLTQISKPSAFIYFRF